MKKDVLSKILAIIYIVVIFTNYILIEPVFSQGILGRVRYILSSIIIFAAIAVFILKRQQKIKKDTLCYLLINIIPYMLIVLIVLIKYLFNSDNSYNTWLSQILYWIIPIFQMQCALYLFGEKAINYTFIATILNYMVCIITYLLQYGVDGIINFFKYTKLGVTVLETHELTFSLGLLFIYYILFENKHEKFHKTKIALCIICLFLGFKRIEIVAIIFAIIIKKFLDKLKDKNKIKFMNIVGVLCIVFSMLYITIIHNGTFRQILEKYRVNSNSRLDAYEYFNKDYEINVTYSGKSLGYVQNKLLNAGTILYGIGDLHNDILKLYIELGFIIWSIYMIYILIIQHNLTNKLYGLSTAQVYFVLMMFTFVIYLTDNVNRYLMYILVFSLIPYTHYLKVKKKEVQKIDSF